MRCGRLPQNSFERLKIACGKGLAAGFMETAGGVVRISPEETVSCAETIVHGEEDICICFHRVYAQLVSHGFRPERLFLTFNARRRDSEKSVKEKLEIISSLCACKGIALFPVAVQTLYDQRSVSMLMQGHACKKAYAPKKGDKICMAGFAGSAGTLKALTLKNDILKERFSPFWLEKAKKAMITDHDDIFGAVSAQEAFMQPVAEGGVMAALWDMKERLGCGFFIDRQKILFRQETIEVCELFDIDPYSFSGDGSMLIVCSDAEKISEKMLGAGVPFAVLGELTADNACRIKKKDEESFLDRPAEDGIWKISDISWKDKEEDLL